MEVFNPYTEAAERRRTRHLAWALGALLLTAALLGCSQRVYKPRHNSKPLTLGMADTTSPDPVTNH